MTTKSSESSEAVVGDVTSSDGTSACDGTAVQAEVEAAINACKAESVAIVGDELLEDRHSCLERYDKWYYRKARDELVVCYADCRWVNKTTHCYSVLQVWD